jgi:hypothetical protein
MQPTVVNFVGGPPGDVTALTQMQTTHTMLHRHCGYTPDEFVIHGPINPGAVEAYFAGLATAAGVASSREWFDVVAGVLTNDELNTVLADMSHEIAYEVTTTDVVTLRECYSGGLRKVKLRKVRMSDEVAAYLFDIVKDSGTITELDLNEITVSGPILEECIGQLRGNTALRQLHIVEARSSTGSIVDAILATARHLPALERLSFMDELRFASVDLLVDLIRGNRSLVDIRNAMMPYYSDAEIDLIATAMRQNWSLTYLPFGNRCLKCANAPHSPCDIRGYLARNSDMQWKKVHTLVLDACIALRPLRLTAREVLMIVDWIPPLHHRFEHRGMPDFDPNHVRKMRLIECVME